MLGIVRTYSRVLVPRIHQLSIFRTITGPTLRLEQDGTQGQDITKVNPPEPPPPELCCMTGCANCVWIQYVDELMEFYQEKGKEVADKALEEIPDNSMKIFLKMELKFRGMK